ncbi:MAG: hypothetical protein ACPG4Y_03835 [Chitinophagales bacterium]
MITKEKLKAAIDSLPKEFTIEDVIEKIILVDKVEQGLKDIEEGNTFTTEEVLKHIDYS